jgi:hypothetical protein
LKPNPARRIALADPGLKPGRVEEKTGEEKTRCDPATRKDRVANPLAFIYFLFYY